MVEVNKEPVELSGGRFNGMPTTVPSDIHRLMLKSKDGKHWIVYERNPVSRLQFDYVATKRIRKGKL